MKALRRIGLECRPAVVCEATGVTGTIAEGTALVRRDGIVVAVGLHARPVSINLTSMVRRQIQLRGSFRPLELKWPQALVLMVARSPT